MYTYYHKPNVRGVYLSMNSALSLVQTETLIFLNSGDVFTKNSFEIIKNYFSKNNNLFFLFGTVKRNYLGNNVIVKTGFKRIKLNSNE